MLVRRPDGCDFFPAPILSRSKLLKDTTLIAGDIFPVPATLFNLWFKAVHLLDSPTPDALALCSDIQLIAYLQVPVLLCFRSSQ